MHVYNVQPESGIDLFHAVEYSCATAPACHLGLMPNEEQFRAALHAFAASVGQRALLLHVNSSRLSC